MLGECLWASLQPLLEVQGKQDLLGTGQKPPAQGRRGLVLRGKRSKDWSQEGPRSATRHLLTLHSVTDSTSIY